MRRTGSRSVTDLRLNWMARVLVIPSRARSPRGFRKMKKLLWVTARNETNMCTCVHEPKFVLRRRMGVGGLSAGEEKPAATSVWQQHRCDEDKQYSGYLPYLLRGFFCCWISHVSYINSIKKEQGNAVHDIIEHIVKKNAVLNPDVPSDAEGSAAPRQQRTTLAVPTTWTIIDFLPPSKQK